MATIEKRTRLSRDGSTEYQLEFKERSAGLLSEYRVRRGAKGTWTKWFRTQSTTKLLLNLGFSTEPATYLNDFYFESFFGRGRIIVNRQVIKHLAGSSGSTELNNHLFSRAIELDSDTWVIPASALETERIFNYLRDLIRENT